MAVLILLVLAFLSWLGGMDALLHTGSLVFWALGMVGAVLFGLTAWWADNEG